MCRPTGGQGAADVRMGINIVPSFGDFYMATADGVSTISNCTMPVNPSFPVSKHLPEPASDVWVLKCCW